VKEEARTRRRAATVIIGASLALMATGCVRPWRPTTPTTPPTPAPTTATTMPGGHGGDDHGGGGGDDHGGGGGDDHGAGGSHSIPPRLNHPPTPAQQAAADKLIRDNKTTNASRFATTAQARAAGFISIGDEMSGVTHYEHPAWRRDGRELDVNYPEALVYKTATGRLQTVMYILEPGKNMNNVPDIAGNLTVWHGHNELCWKSENPDSPDYLHLAAGFVRNGKCSNGYFRFEPPMLHVWVVDNPCGPFAGTDPGRRSGSCVQH
jgi:hypothetical protein